MEPVAGSVGATATPDDECSATKSPAKLAGFALIASGSATEKPVASGWHKCIFVRKRGDRWFFTSLFLMRLMAAPVVRLRTWKMLVWSEAWNAEGEKAKMGYWFKHTPTRAGVP
jgi:hypothetical protein